MRLHAASCFLLLVASTLGQSLPQPPEAVLIAPPKYPPLARQAQIVGTVTIELRVTSNGDVDDVRTISGHPMLMASVNEAVRRWKFECHADSCLREFPVTFKFVLAGKEDDPQQTITLELPTTVTVAAHPVSVETMRSLLPKKP